MELRQYGRKTQPRQKIIRKVFKMTTNNTTKQFFGGRQKLAESIMGLDENTDKSLAVCKAAALLHTITQETNDE